MPVNSQFSLGVLLLSCLLFPIVSSSDAQRGAIRGECRDRNFLLTVDQSITTKTLRIEAIDATGVHPINKDYSATCGYTYSEFNMAGFITLRASYYSCHTVIQDDQVFSAEFNVISTDHLGGETVHHVAKTCTLSLPWMDREVLCEENYMEVSVRNDACALQRSSPGKDQDSKLATLPALTGWHVVFMEDEEEVGMTVDEARAIGYGVTITDGRVVFRSAYVQHHTDIAMIDGISTVEIHTTMILRHKWMVKMLDLSAACTINSGGFDPETLRVFWEIPTVMAPLVYDLSEFASVQVGVGVEGQLLDEYTWRGRGYSLDVNGSLTCLSVPIGAEGGHRRSLVINNTYHEFYSIYLYYEHLFLEGLLETRHRMPRACSTPQLPRYPYTIDQTVPEEYVFTVYLGDFPFDVELVAVALSGESYTVSEAIQSGYTISMARHTNGTHGYVLKVPLEDPVVLRMYLGEGLVQYSLEINYTLSIMPQHDYYYHLASVMALIKDAFPPDVQAACTEGSIIFQIPQHNLGHMWEITVGPYPLTPELAARRGYFLQNTDQSLTLEVPVFTIGFIYEDITLNHFFGTFEVLTRDAKTLDIQKSTAKRCLFNTNELIVCSTDGVMTAVVSLAVAIPPMSPSRTTLLDTNCGPQETDATRVLFAFGVNTCGTRFLEADHYLVFENEIISHREFQSEWEPTVTRDSEFRVTVQCFYEANSTNRLFVDNTFKSETPGFGTIKESSPKEHAKEHQYTPTTSDTVSYGVQNGSQPNGYSATEVHTANVVPSTYQGSRTQHVPSSSQPTHGSHEADGAQKLPTHYATIASSEAVRYVTDSRVPSTETAQHGPSSIYPSLSHSTDQNGRHGYSASSLQFINVVPSTHEGSSIQYMPAVVQPTHSHHEADVQNVSAHYSTGGDSRTTQYISSGSGTHTETTQHRPSTIHPASSPYSTDQDMTQTGYSAASVQYINVVPGTSEGSTIQHVPSVQPTHSSHEAEVQNVSGHYSTGVDITHYATSGSGTAFRETTQHVPSNIHPTSSPYSTDQGIAHPTGYTSSSVQFINVVPSAHEGTGIQHIPTVVQPTHGGHEADVQNVSVHPSLIGHSSTTQYISSGSGTLTETTQHGPSTIHPASSPYSTDQGISHPTGYSASNVQYINVVPSAPEASTIQHVPTVIQPTLGSHEADVQYISAHYSAGGDSRTTQYISSGTGTYTETTQHRPSTIHPASSPYSTDQGISHPTGYSASNVQYINVVPSAPEASTIQHVPTVVQPTHGSHEAGVQNVSVHYSTGANNRTTHYTSSGSGTAFAETTQHAPSNIHPTYSTHEGDGHSAASVQYINVVPSTHEGSGIHHTPNVVQPAHGSYEPDVQNVSAHYSAGGDSRTIQYVSSGSGTVFTETTQQEPSNIHPTGHSASSIQFINVVPSAPEASTIQHVPTVVQPTHGVYEAGVRNVSVHYSAGASRTTPYTSSGSATTFAGTTYAETTQHGPSTIHPASSPYSTDQGIARPTGYTSSSVQFINVVPSAHEGTGIQHIPTVVQPTHSGHEADVQNVSVHPSLTGHSSTTQYISSGSGTHTETTQHGPSTIHPASSPYSTDQGIARPTGYTSSSVQFINVVPSAHEGTGIQHIPTVVQPTHSGHETDVQNVSVHPSLTGHGSATQYISSGSGTTYAGTTHAETTQHGPSTIHPASSPYSTDQGISHPTGYPASSVQFINVVPSALEGSSIQHVPNVVRPTHGSHEAGVQNASVHYSAGADGRTTSSIASGSGTAFAETTQHAPSNIHPTSSTHGTHEGNGYSAARVQYINVVPSTHEGSGIHHMPNAVQQAHGRYEPDVQSVSAHRPSGGSSTTQYSGSYAQPGPSSNYPSSVGTSTDQSRGYSASSVQFINVVPSIHDTGVSLQASSGVQPTLGSYETVNNVTDRYGTSEGSSTTQFVSSSSTNSQIGATKNVPSSIHPTYTSHSTDQTSHSSRVQFTNVVSNTQEGSHSRQVPSISYGAEGTLESGVSSNSVIERGSTHYSGDPSPTKYGVNQHTGTLSSKEHPQEVTYPSSGVKSISSLSGGIILSSVDPPEVNCTSHSSKNGTSKFVQVQSKSRYGLQTDVRQAAKKG